ncbi:MAG: esterase [SAR86 cluster bacterium]|uniref:Esterase n=1 Tax=SAR86 cluster bacterium TaxID=2030880 RepID=A0A520MWI1_9GAMM|nr:MAG: esterase [SAR86 cluster bacterium]|tara:strand:+ start:2287 stop:2862 length:576 start_codon:yes stop_codon:yes gene_type:complete
MKNKDLILYIHGWNSHKDARKAILLKDKINPSINFQVESITLQSHPKEAILQLSKFIEKERGERKVHLVGSSLGGYYATFLSEKYNLKSVMINPAVWAYKIFKNDMGENKNLNTNESYIIDEEWVASLKEIFVEKPSSENYLVLLQTGDETLNYKFSAEYYDGSKIIIDEGGNHSFENLEIKIPQMLLHFS